MSDALDAFERRLKSVAGKAARRLTEHADRTKLTSQRLAERHTRFHQRAAELVRVVALPRCERLAGRLPHARLTGPDRARGDRVELAVPFTPRFPAAAHLTVEIVHDAEIERLSVVLEQRFLPRFLHVSPGAELSFALSRVEASKAAAWLEEQLADFYETYLRLEFVDHTQRSVLATDPVCGVRFSRHAAGAELEYGGQAFWFVSTEARDRFVRQPARYVALAPFK